MRQLIIALAMFAVTGTALAQGEQTESLPTRQIDIHNHTDLTISRLSLRRLAIGPDLMSGEAVPALETMASEEGPEETSAWEDVLDETGAPQVLETHTHLTVSWAAQECWAEFKAELSDGTAEYGNVDACNDTQLQFGAHFDHE